MMPIVRKIESNFDHHWNDHRSNPNHLEAVEVLESTGHLVLVLEALLQ